MKLTKSHSKTRKPYRTIHHAGGKFQLWEKVIQSQQLQVINIHLIFKLKKIPKNSAKYY